MPRSTWLATFTLVLLTPPASAVDLEKIDHPLRKEPVYQSKTPKYCLAVLGPKAEMRVWLVLDGDVLYVDRNGNGDLTEPDERVKIATPDQDPAQFSEIDITDSQGKKVAKLSAHAWGWLQRKNDPQAKLEVTVDATLEDGRRFVAWGDEKSPLVFATRPADAPVVHFGGPLVMGLEIRQPLRRKSAAEFELNMAVGCKGRGVGSFAALIYTPVPKDAYPRVVFEFPGPAADQSIKAELIVKDRC
jgi:hypothetical protein